MTFDRTTVCTICPCTLAVSWTADDPPISIVATAMCICAGHGHAYPKS